MRWHGALFVIVETKPATDTWGLCVSGKGAMVAS
jgi:hypothetical protein